MLKLSETTLQSYVYEDMDEFENHKKVMLHTGWFVKSESVYRNKNEVKPYCIYSRKDYEQ